MNQIQICPKCGEVGAPGTVPCDGKPLPPIRPFDHQTTLEKVLRSYLWKPNDILERGAIALPKCIKAKEYKEAGVWQDRLRNAEEEKKQWEYLLELYEQERQEPNGPLVTNHHPNCPHYNDSLIDVWKVTVDGRSCYVDNEQDALDTVGDSGSVSKEKMHKEIFEHLPEFEGF